MEDTPFIRFLRFIKSRQPTDVLSTDDLREFLLTKPEKMGLGYEARWKEMRVEAERLLAAREEERRHQ